MSHPFAASCSSSAPDSMFPADHELRFQSLFDPGRSLVFPCDARGRVALDGLSERARENYLYARATVGHEYSVPAVQPSDLH
ncbi:MAG: hypothetical protein RJA98_955 [Pseudomonadota bacterium]|jgi:hypothetical protein